MLKWLGRSVKYWFNFINFLFMPWKMDKSWANFIQNFMVFSKVFLDPKLSVLTKFHLICLIYDWNLWLHTNIAVTYFQSVGPFHKDTRIVSYAKDCGGILVVMFFCKYCSVINLIYSWQLVFLYKCISL